MIVFPGIRLVNRPYPNRQALADFRKVLELDPRNADALKSIEVIEKIQKQGDSQ